MNLSCTVTFFHQKYIKTCDIVALIQHYFILSVFPNPKSSQLTILQILQESRQLQNLSRFNQIYHFISFLRVCTGSALWLNQSDIWSAEVTKKTFSCVSLLNSFVTQDFHVHDGASCDYWRQHPPFFNQVILFIIVDSLPPLFSRL